MTVLVTVTLTVTRSQDSVRSTTYDVIIEYLSPHSVDSVPGFMDSGVWSDKAAPVSQIWWFI